MYDWLAEQTQNNWIFFFTAVTFVILVGGIVAGFVKSAKRKRIKRSIGIFLQQGDNIRVQCSNQQQPPPEKDALAWADEVSKYLVKNLGEDYSPRFYNSDGLPLAATYLSGEHARTESFVRFRIARLHQFLAELNK
jgi:hypothetical protein